MKNFVIGFPALLNINLTAGLFLLLSTGCTKSAQIECPECGTLAPVVPSFRQDSLPSQDTLSGPDSHTIVIDDTLIL